PSTFAQLFWLIVFATIVLNVVTGRRRAAALVAENRVTDDELREFTRNLMVGSALYCLSLAGIQRAGHFADPLCALAFPPTSGYGIAAWIVVAGTTSLILRWLWSPGGELLARVAPAFTRGPVSRTFSATRVRAFVTGLLIVALGGNIAVQLATPELASRCLTRS